MQKSLKIYYNVNKNEFQEPEPRRVTILILMQNVSD